jgi:uncharacterized protein YbbC (DUF1343 family)
MKLFFQNKIYIGLLVSLFVISSCQTVKYHLSEKRPAVETGLEIFLKDTYKDYRGKKIILITNHSGRNANLLQNISLLRSKGIIITTILAPEHGINGSQQNYDSRIMIPDYRRHLVIYNLHKLKRKQLKFLIKKHDAAVFDIQDMGMRCYTYISNLKNIINAMTGLPTELIVLDRPNPVAFLDVKGFNLDKKFKTRFVSNFPAPLFYNLTLGEAALYYNSITGSQTNVSVIKMRGYSGDMMYHKTGLPWIPPSPNLPNYESAIMYTITVLMEGITLSIGRGTSKPFEYIGAPWINGEKMAHDLNAMKLKSFRFRPVYFTPSFSYYRNRQCRGVHIYYTGGSFDPLEITYAIMSYLIKKYPRRIIWVKKDSFYWIDALAGTDKFRKRLLKRKPYSVIKKEIEKSTAVYKNLYRRYKLY